MTVRLLATLLPLYPTLFKVNSHNFIFTFPRFLRDGEAKKKEAPPPKKKNIYIYILPL